MPGNGVLRWYDYDLLGQDDARSPANCLITAIVFATENAS